MKKLIALVLSMVCVVSTVACNWQPKPKKRWDCTFICAKEPTDHTDAVSYCDKTIVSDTGILTIDNTNDFDVRIHLVADGKERVETIGAGKVTTLYQIAKDTEYTLGCYADVPEGTEIIIPIYDGAGNVLLD